MTINNCTNSKKNTWSIEKATNWYIMSCTKIENKKYRHKKELTEIKNKNGNLIKKNKKQSIFVISCHISKIKFKE